MRKHLLTMLLLLLSLLLFADGVQPEGSGTENDPYRIATLDNLLWMSTYPDSLTFHFIQTADIDASDTQNWNDGAGWHYFVFYGVYDGQDHSISNLYTYSTDNSGTGFFSGIRNAEIKNLYLQNVDFLGHYYSGGLAAFVRSSLIINCHVTGSIFADDSGVGGIAGSVSSSVIEDCSFAGNVTGLSKVGGAFGYVQNNSDIVNIHSNANVNGFDESVGGLIGRAVSNSDIFDCRAEGTVDGIDIVGGLIGNADGGSDLNDSFFVGSVAGQNNVGGLIGIADDGSDCKRNYFQGNVVGELNVGGLIGYCHDLDIDKCHTSGSVTGYEKVGGFIGYALSRIEIKDSWMESDIDGEMYVGGFAGYFERINVLTDYMPITMINSYYDYESVRINNEHAITFGAVDHELYELWRNSDLELDIDDLLVNEDGEYLISTPEDLQTLMIFGYDEGNSYRLTQDIDLSEYDQFSIPYFKGEIQGDHHRIKNTTLSSNTASYTGFFGIIEYSSIENLYVENIDVRGQYIVGGFAGWVINVSFTDCSVKSTVIGRDHVGGFAGILGSDSCVERCSSNAIVCGDNRIGGFAGAILYNSIAYDSCSKGSVSCSVETAGGFAGSSSYYSRCYQCFSDVRLYDGNRMGGFCGHAFGGSMHNCYSHSTISNGQDLIGGFYGFDSCCSTVNCYCTGSIVGESNVGGFLADYQTVEMENCFWDIETSGQTESAGGTGLTTAEMKARSTYTEAGWDFINETENGTDNYWAIDEDLNDGYPYLTWQDFTPIDDDPTIPPEFDETRLYGNYPNPFNPTTTIRFSVKSDEKAALTIYNLKGQKVKSFPRFDSGPHEVVWMGENDAGKQVASGVYLYRLETGSKEQMRKMLLLK